MHPSVTGGGISAGVVYGYRGAGALDLKGDSGRRAVNDVVVWIVGAVAGRQTACRGIRSAIDIDGRATHGGRNGIADRAAGAGVRWQRDCDGGHRDVLHGWGADGISTRIFKPAKCTLRGCCIGQHGQNKQPHQQPCPGCWSLIRDCVLEARCIVRFHGASRGRG